MLHFSRRSARQGGWPGETGESRTMGVHFTTEDVSKQGVYKASCGRNELENRLTNNPEAVDCGSCKRSKAHKVAKAHSATVEAFDAMQAVASAWIGTGEPEAVKFVSRATDDTEVRIALDIIEVSGPRVEDVKILGMVPESVDNEDFNLYVRFTGQTVSVDKSHTDETVASATSARGGRIANFQAAMQYLANFYGVPVVVACDPGVSGGQSARLVGRWEPEHNGHDMAGFRAGDRVIQTYTKDGEGRSIGFDIIHVTPAYVLIKYTDRDGFDSFGVHEFHGAYAAGHLVKAEDTTAVPTAEPEVPVKVGDLVRNTDDDTVLTITRADEFWIGGRFVGEWRAGRQYMTRIFRGHLASGVFEVIEPTVSAQDRVAGLPDCCNECDGEAVDRSRREARVLVKPALRANVSRRRRKASKRASKRHSVKGGK